MSTQYDTRPATQYAGPHAGDQAPRPGNSGRSGFRIAVIAVGSVIAAALVALAAVGLTHHTTSHTATPAASASAPASTAPSANPAQPTTPAQANPAQPSAPASPAVVPSASVKKLQQELGQLNYYEGPADGIMGPQTTAAIQNLQRQAGLPQTGTMNTATQTALDNYLIHGNNQMAG
jgi:peptidoglycan hydrolase-like protein with peptidoglycan-binding domain